MRISDWSSDVCSSDLHGVLAARPVFANGVHVFVELVEGRMRQPGFVEMQGIDFGTQLFLDHLDVVDDAVVGALRKRQYARPLVLGIACKRVGFDLLAYVFGVRSEEHTSELQSLMRISYAVFCLKKKKKTNK